MKTYLIVTTFLLFLMCTTPALALSFHWAPMGTELTVPRGEKSVKFTADIINEIGEEQYFQLQIFDLNQKRNGKYEPLELGGVEYSCAEWIEILGTRTLFVPDKEVKEPVLEPYEGEFILVGGEWKEIVFEISIPRKAKGGYSALVVCEPIQKEEPEEEQIPEELKKELEGAEVREITKGIGAKTSTVVLLTVGEEKRTLKKKVELTGTVEKTEEGGIKIIGSLTNKGMGHVFGKGQLRIKRKGGRTIKRPLGSGRGAVLRSSTVDLATMFEKVRQPGEYEADLRIYYGARRPKRIKIPFSVTREGVGGKYTRTIDFDVPDMIERTVLPGGHRTFTIPVINYESDMIHLKARPISFRYDESGELVEQEGPLSAVSLTTLKFPVNEGGECEFDLKPGQATRIKVEMDFSDLPRETRGGRYTAIECDGTKKGVEGTTVLTSPVFLTMAGELEKKGEIVSAKMSRAEGTGFMNFVVEFRNKGNIHVSPTGKTIIRKWNEELEGKGGFEELGEIMFKEVTVPILPGDTRILEAVYPEELELGEYVMNITIEGLDEPVTLEGEFTITEKEFIIKQEGGDI